LLLLHSLEDSLIIFYDGDTYWMDRERFVELGAGVIRVEHGTSEMRGMENLAHPIAPIPYVRYPRYGFCAERMAARVCSAAR